MSKFEFKLHHSKGGQHPKQFHSDLKWWALDSPDEGFIISLEKNNQVFAVSSVLFRLTGFKPNSERVAHFGHHFVAPSMRQQGVFTDILKYSEELCMNNGISSILVTPNKQSEGIYRSHDYNLIDDINSHLYLIDVNKTFPRSSEISQWKISASDYYDTTLGFPKLHQMDKSRFEWRFSHPETKYLFLSGQSKNDYFHIAFRKGKKGPIDVYVIAEIFLNGGKPDLGQVATLVRQCLPEFGVPLHAKVITQSFTSNTDDANISMYRTFPFAIKHFNSSDPDWVTRLKYYQFSDSDFG